MACISGIFAVLVGVLAWQDWRVFAAGTPTPVDVSLASLTTKGVNGNPHVRVTDLQFGATYVVETNNGAWNRVWVPVLFGGGVRAVVKTFNVSDEGQLRALCSRRDVTGIVTNDLHSLGSAEVGKLTANYPGVDFYSLPVIEHARVFPTAGRVWSLTGASLGLLTLAAGTGLASALRSRREKEQAGQVSVPATAAATRPAGGEGLGELRRVFPTGHLGKSAIGGGAFFLLLLGGFAVFALTHSKPEDLYAGYIVLGSLAMACVLLIVVGVAQLRDSAALHADGLTCRRFGKAMSCRWDEVESVRGMVRVPTRFQPAYLGGPLLVRTVAGKTLRFGDVQDIGELIDAVYQEVLRRQLPRALETIRRGETVSIGPLRFDGTGVGDRRGRSLAWDDVEEVGVPRDKIVIRQVGARWPWWTGSMAMPNAGLLLELATACRRGEVG
jgi:hypothetical protein